MSAMPGTQTTRGTLSDRSPRVVSIVLENGMLPPVPNPAYRTSDLFFSFVYHEVRMAFAALFWNFDFELAPESVHWDKGHVAEYIQIIRQKRALYVKAKPRDFTAEVKA